VQSAYAQDIATYNKIKKLKGNDILTVKKVCDYLQKQYFSTGSVYGEDDTGWLLPLDFTIL